MESLDGLASLTLLPHRQAFVVKFLCEVKYPLPKVKKQITMSSMQIKYRCLRVSLKAIKMGKAMAGPYFKHFDQQVVWWFTSFEKCWKNQKIYTLLWLGGYSVFIGEIYWKTYKIISYRGYYLCWNITSIHHSKRNFVSPRGFLCTKLVSTYLHSNFSRTLCKGTK